MSSGEYILPYRKIIQVVVWQQLVEPGYFPYQDKEELVQSVILILIEREEKILDAFMNKARFSTYLTTVIVNICRDIRKTELRKRSKEYDPASDLQEALFTNIEDSSILADQQVDLDRFCKRLRISLSLFEKSKGKLIFCLKAISRIPMNAEDITAIQGALTLTELIVPALLNLNNPEVHLTDQLIYDQLTLIFNLVEDKKNTKDAIRKWMEDKVQKLIEVVNGEPQVAAFDRETIQYLFEYCNNKSKK
ncbi:MAG: hypothetical protein WCL00_07970 [Bacteroidota bacterium]